MTAPPVPADYPTWLADIRSGSPEARGFSSANVRSMRAFAEACPDPAMLQRPSANCPGGQTVALVEVKNPNARLCYPEAALAPAWNRPVLAVRIATRGTLPHGATDDE